MQGRRAKRRRRWKEEEKVGTGKRCANYNLNEEGRCRKRIKIQEKSQPLIKDSLKSVQEKGCKVVQEVIQEKGTPRSQKEEIPREIQEERKRVQNTEMKKKKSVKDADKNKFNSVLKMFREMEERGKNKK